MNTSILIAGFCLLALTSTITEALDKKQNLDCATPSSSLQSCIDQVASGTSSVCSDDSCSDALLQYYTDCGVPREAFDALCPGDNDGGDNDGGDNDGGDNDGGDNDGGDNDGGDNDGGDSSAATVGVTLFTIVSAVLVAVDNYI